MLLFGCEFVAQVLELRHLSSMLITYRARVLTKVVTNAIWIVVMEHQRSSFWTLFLIAIELLYVIKINVIVLIIILVLVVVIVTIPRWLVKLLHHFKPVLLCVANYAVSGLVIA
jgi:hypothetical protein